MLKQVSIAVFCLVSLNSRANSALTPTETRWLNAGDAVLTYAEEQKLPVDIIVQPETKPGDVPLAMGFDGGRCKLVLTLRNNPDAESILADVAPANADIVIEAMMAHEIAHCWRYTQGAGIAAASRFASVQRTPASGQTSVQLEQEMKQTRREEGLADLFGLAWTLRRHPDRYAQIHAWFEQVRDNQPVPGGHHDTLPWVELAQDRAAFQPGSSPFEQAHALWQHISP